MNIQVKGHSGCSVEIIRENDQLLILKSTYDKGYLNRLYEQAEKQKQAAQEEYQHIRIPQILDVTKNEELVSIKMEYVYSKNFIEYFESAGFEQISYFIKALILFIEKEIRNCSVQIVKKDVLIKKYEDVKNKILSNHLLQEDPIIHSILEKSSLIFENVQDMKMPIGLCHGDLTFSNILFNGNNYYLIDFLDSFVESPLLDIVKIRQDSAYLWSQLLYIHSFDRIRLQLISKHIDNAIDSYFQKYEWYRDYYKCFQLMNFLRILQYAKEKNIIDYLKKVSNNILYEL